MKRCIKLLSFVCLFASCQSYGMNDEQKETTAPTHRLSGAEIINIYKTLLQNKKTWGTATQISDYTDETMIELQYENGIKKITLINKNWIQQQYTYGSLPTLMIRNKFDTKTQRQVPFIFSLGGFHLHTVEYTDLALLGSTESDRAYLKEWDEEEEYDKKMKDPHHLGLVEKPKHQMNEYKETSPVDMASVQNPFQQLIISQHVLNKFLSETTHSQNPLQQLPVYDETFKQKYKTALDDQLYPMPLELIDIIISYMFPLCQLQGKCIATIDNQAVCVIELSHNQIIALDSCSSENIKIHNSENGAFEREIPADPHYLIYKLIYLSDDKLLLLLVSKQGEDYKLALYNAATGKLLNESPNHEATWHLVKLAKNVFATATFGHNNGIQIWNTAKNILKQKRTITLGSSPIREIIKLSHQQIAVTDLFDPKMNVYNWKMGKLKHTLHTQYRPNMVRLAGSILISYQKDGDRNNRLDLWDCSTGQCLKSFSDKYITRVVALPSRLILITRRSYPATISDPRTGDTIKQLSTLMDFDSDILPLHNNRFVTYGIGSDVQLWQ